MSSAPHARLAKLTAWARHHFRDLPKSGRVKHFLHVAGDVLGMTPRADRVDEYERELAFIADIGQQLFFNVQGPARSKLHGRKV